MNYLNTGLLQSLIAIILIITFDVCAEVLVFKKIHNKKKRARSKVILRYILFFIALFVLAKIWVEGFGHLLAFVGFISAALTIAQKENILNFTGGFIISWRNSFGEGDYVQIAGYQGLVKDLGPFFFTLEELDPRYSLRKTGRFIKLPNSIVTLQPFVTYNNEGVTIHEESVILPFSIQYNELENIITMLDAKLQEYFLKIAVNYSLEEKRIYEKILKKEKVKNPFIEVKLEQGDSKGYKLCIQYYALVKDLKIVSNQVRKTLLETVQSELSLLIDN